MRYADDQIIFSPTKDIANLILFEATKELFKINLSINSSKVIVFDSLVEYDTYWAFHLFQLLEKPYDYEKINRCIEIFFDNIEQRKKFKEESVLKKLLSTDFFLIHPEKRFKLLAKIFEDNFLSKCDEWFLKRIYLNVSNKEELFTKLDELVPKVLYNSFHYNLLKFNKKHHHEISNDYIIKRIKELAIK